MTSPENGNNPLPQHTLPSVERGSGDASLTHLPRERGASHRGTTTERGYGAQHRRLRKALTPTVESGRATCWRCGQPIHPGQPWDLGHDDHDRTQYRGPEHAGRDCPAGGNRATAGRTTWRRPPEPHPGLKQPRPQPLPRGCKP